MAEVDNTRDLTRFKALSFDCYGTLVDWEGGILQTLEPITSKLPPDHAYAKDPKQALLRFNNISQEIQVEQPALRHDINLRQSVKKLITEIGSAADGVDGDAVAEAMASGPGKWPAFPDTVEGLRVLKKHYKLIILSNATNANIQACVSGPLRGVTFDAVYTAEDVGSYKPDPKNFKYLFEHAKDELGVDHAKGDLLHVARSLPVDHTAAKAMGFESVWISRGGEKKEIEGVGGNYEGMLRDGEVSFQWRFDTIGDFGKEVARQFGDA